jgi:hypothetical protein
MDVDILTLAKEICDLFLYVFKYFKKRALKQGQRTFLSRSSRYKVGVLWGFGKGRCPRDGSEGCFEGSG